MEEPLALSHLGERIAAFNVLDLKSPLERGGPLAVGCVLLKAVVRYVLFFA